MHDNVIQSLEQNAVEIIKRQARLHMMRYAKYMRPDLEIEPFHRIFYELLDMFAHGKIMRLIISMPPQHGKSEGCSRLLPSYMLGLNPDKKIVIGSYATSFAQDFNRDNQRLIDSNEYRDLFPNTFLNRTNAVTMANVYKRNTNVIECVGHKGFLRVVGRGGALTGISVDVAIMDDLYKDYEEGNSPIIRDKAWNWYTSVMRKRLHNESQQLIVFTRWNEDDVIGRLEKSNEQVVEIKSLNEINVISSDAWIKVNFPAIKMTEPTPIDPRPKGTALWERKHSLQKHISERALDPIQFECLNQGNPRNAEGLLYGDNWKQYTLTDHSEYGVVVGHNNYTDTADTGDDYLCSICYDVTRGIDTDGSPCKYILVADIYYSDKPNEYTVPGVAGLLQRNMTRESFIESNNGGRSFALMVGREAPKTCRIQWFYQSKNKESRILSNAALVKAYIVMPYGWRDKYPEFAEHITGYKRQFGANKWHDAADVLTGIIEREIVPDMKGKKSGVNYVSQPTQQEIDRYLNY